jgi:hypothetical protein
MTYLVRSLHPPYTHTCTLSAAGARGPVGFGTSLFSSSGLDDDDIIAEPYPAPGPSKPQQHPPGVPPPPPPTIHPPPLPTGPEGSVPSSSSSNSGVPEHAWPTAPSSHGTPSATGAPLSAPGLLLPPSDAIAIVPGGTAKSTTSTATATTGGRPTVAAPSHVSGAAPAQLTGSAPPPPPVLPPPPAPSEPHPSVLAQQRAQQQELELQRRQQQQEQQQQVQLRGSRAPAPSLLSIPAVCGARGQYVTDSCLGVDGSLHTNAVYVSMYRQVGDVHRGASDKPHLTAQGQQEPQQAAHTMPATSPVCGVQL